MTMAGAGHPGRSEIPAAGTLVDALASHAARFGERIALSFLERGERVGEQLSYAALDRAARSAARCLEEAGLRGRPVFLPSSSSKEFVCCFFGCLYAGAFAVPSSPLQGKRAVERAEAILGDLGPCGVIAPSVKGARKAPEFALATENRIVLPAAEALAATPAAGPARHGPDDLAFIQYTSGSLGRPRGVAVTHRNIMANLGMIRDAFAINPDDVMVSWLPLHHDMGLIGSVLATLGLGIPCTLMSPFDFMLKPLRWLRAIESFRATVSGGPNFAYDLCARLIDEKEAAALDLSSWRLAFCGSEPVRANTLKAFAGAFAPSGFSRQAFYPCYGLAEATLLVSGGKAGTGYRTRQFNGESVSCGHPFGDGRILIAEHGGAPVAPGETGEIFIAGSHVSPGYWSAADGGLRPDADNRVEIGGESFLRTGDIGVIDESGLFVLGRSRDMIIVRGLKLHAEDIEATVLDARQDDRLLASAAFSVETGDTETLVIVCEMRHTAKAQGESDLRMVERLRALIGETHGILPKDIVFVPANAIPRTSSGKVRRSACRDLYESGKLLTGPHP